MRVAIRPTIPSDLAAVTHEPLPIRIRAITALDGDRVLGIGGIGYRPDGVVIGFAFIGEEFRRYPTAVHRAGLAMMRVIKESGVPEVVAMADMTAPGAERWLERLGFNSYRRSGEQFYVWRAAHGDVE